MITMIDLICSAIGYNFTELSYIWAIIRYARKVE